MELSHIMRRSWNRRANNDAMHHINNSRPLGWWGKEDFFHTGQESITRMLDPFLAQHVKRAKMRTCLEIGCGVGRETMHLAERFKRVLALDVSDAMLDQARDLIPATNVTFVLGDGITLDVITSERVSFVYSGWVFQHIPDPEVQYNYLREIGRVLRPGGSYFVQLYADHEAYERKAAAWHERAAGQVLKGWSKTAWPEIQSGEYATWICTAVDVDTTKQALTDAGLTLVYSEGEGRQAWHIGGHKPK